MRTSSVVGLLVSMIAAGCVGTDAGGGPLGAPPAPQAGGPATFNETSGAVQGTVVDGETQPVESALVAIVSDPKSPPVAQSLTDVAGRFTLSNIPPGSYQLAAAKLGYDSASRRIDVVAGQVAEATLNLEKLEVHAGYHTTGIEKGYFECSWTGASTGPCFFPIIGTNNSQVPVDPWTNNKRQFDYDAGPGVMTVFNEMDWDRTSAAMGDSMSVFLSYAARTTSHNYCFAAMPKPVYLRWDRAADSVDPDEEGDCNTNDSSLPDDEPATVPIEGQRLTTRCNTGPGNVPGTQQSTFVGVAFQQSFDLYVSIFYWDHAPEGFTALADT